MNGLPPPPELSSSVNLRDNAPHLSMLNARITVLRRKLTKNDPGRVVFVESTLV